MAPIFSVAPSFGVVPQQAWVGAHGVYDSGYFVDDDSNWSLLISVPPVGPKEGSCIRGAVFSETALHPTQLNVEVLWGLVLDVDEFDGRPIPLEQAPSEIARRLGGCRHIGWTTYNSTASAPRYRVCLPLARPVPRRRYRSLWELVNKELGFVVGEGQWNADRLGYLPRLPSEAARATYRYWVQQGPLLDAEIRFGELYEAPDQVFLGAHAEHAAAVDTSNFVAEDQALARARSYMRDVHQSVKKGARHMKLFEKSCQLWWDFWLQPESVLQVLREINARLEDPKSEHDVLKEVEAGFGWTRGPSSRPQRSIAGGRRMRPPAVTYSGLEERSRRLKRKAGQQELGAAMHSLSRREAFAEPEHILDVTRNLARQIGLDYAQCDARAAARLFWPSLSLMQSQSPLTWPARLGNSPEATIEVIANLISQVHHEKKAQEEHTESERKQKLAARVFDATSGARSTPFTNDELAIFASQQRCSVDDLMRRLIVQVGGSYFFFLGEQGYSTSIEQGMAAYAAKALALFEGDPAFGVSAYTEDKDGNQKLREPNDLVDAYGIHAHGVIYSFYEQRSRYDHEKRRLRIPATPIRREARAERIPEVERYFDLIPDRDSLLDWLAWLPRLDRAARVLMLVGPKDCGKSFMPVCLSRLWGEEGPTKGTTVFHSFNDSMLGNPLVACDEQLPAELRGRRGTERLRDEVIQLTRPVTGKYKKQSVVEGAMRWIITANNARAVETDDLLTKDDVDGLLDRLLAIEIPEAAGAYLRALGFERTAKWVTEDLVAKHVLWLSETRELHNIGRFGPAPRSSEAHSTVADEVAGNVRFGGVSGKVLEWLYNDVVKLNSQHVRWGVNGTNELHAMVNVDDLAQQWEMVLGLQAKRPNRKELVEALRAVRDAVVRDDADRKRFAAVSVNTLEAWAATQDVDLHEVGNAITKALGPNHEKKAHFRRIEGTDLA